MSDGGEKEKGGEFNSILFIEANISLSIYASMERLATNVRPQTQGVSVSQTSLG